VAETKRPLAVAAAADLRFALEEIVTAFRNENADVAVEVSYGSSGNFFAQLINRAPFDMFFSADVEYPRKLAEQELVVEGSEFLYAVGHLVVWVPVMSPIQVEKLGIQSLLDPAAKKIAIANPKHAPYGRAAEAALKKLGVHEQVREQLVYGDNVAQTAQFIQSGAADIGVIGLSQALAPELRETGRFWEVPLDAYPRLDQGGVILSWARDRKAAEDLRAYVLSAKGKEILRRYGFSLPGA
jgi:molybdate transport system substrate-binding protein